MAYILSKVTKVTEVEFGAVGLFFSGALHLQLSLLLRDLEMGG
jgi:hypothetical protein